MTIALTYTGTDEKHNNYVRWLKANDEIDIIKLSVAQNNLHDLDSCDALVIAGGRDIHPRFYNSTVINYDNAPDYFEEDRDELEIAAFNKAIEKQLPVLGVCRGMQLINCILGGNLKQDLGTLNKVHKVEDVVDKAHGVSIQENSLLAKISGVHRTIVNSAHHQSVNELAPNLKSNVIADDGTIEGFEWLNASGKSFMLCVQWHPERMFKFDLENSPVSKNIRDYFIREIKNKKAV